MIAVIDINSSVRQECFSALASDGIPVEVFYSCHTFIDSGAFYGAHLLVLGKTHTCRTKCETLRWACTVRPHLKTLLLKPMRLAVRELIDVCNDAGDSLVDYDSCASSAAFEMAHDLGLFREANLAGNASESEWITLKPRSCRKCEIQLTTRLVSDFRSTREPILRGLYAYE